jgi:hypothetical protein
LLAFPEDAGELIRVLTLSKADISFVRQHRGDHHFAGTLAIHRSQYIDSVDEFTGDCRRPELKSFEQNRGKPSELRIMLGDKGKGVEVLIPSQLFGFSHTSREGIP